MKLRDWLKMSNVSIRSFAKELKVERVMVYRYFTGTMPRANTIRRIELLTEGAVTAQDFYDNAMEHLSSGEKRLRGHEPSAPIQPAPSVPIQPTLSAPIQPFPSAPVQPAASVSIQRTSPREPPKQLSVGKVVPATRAPTNAFPWPDLSGQNLSPVPVKRVAQVATDPSRPKISAGVLFAPSRNYFVERRRAG